MKSVILSLVTTALCLTAASAASDSDDLDLPDSEVQEVDEQIERAHAEAAEQARQAQKQIKEASKAWKEAAKAIHARQAALAVDVQELDDLDDNFEGWPGAMAGLKDQLFALAAPARATAKPLIVRTDLDPGVKADLEEDLVVMSRILNKAAGGGGREEHEWAMGIALSSLGGNRGPRSIYLEGHGALFLINVKFPLVAPPVKDPAEQKQEEASDTEWEQTKDELFGDRRIRRRGPVVQPFMGGELHLSGKEGTRMEYDAGRVAELRKSILEALKNATNIRNLRPDDLITVALTGPSQGPATSVWRIQSEKKAPPPKAGRDVVTVVKANKAMAGDETHLIVRVKKSDADAFAKGNLTYEAFEKAASVVGY